VLVFSKMLQFGPLC